MLGEAFREVFKADYELKCTDIDVNGLGLAILISVNLIPTQRM